jgi:hypothetical protein
MRSNLLNVSSFADVNARVDALSMPSARVLATLDWAARPSGSMAGCRIIPPILTIRRYVNFAKCRSPRPFSGKQTGYPFRMTKLLQKALEAVRRLPPDTQDEIARVMLSLTGDQEESEEIDPAHLPDVLESLAQARRRQFATDAEVEAAFRRFDR